MARFRSALVLLSAAAGLGGCTSLYGAPGYGVSVGYGNQGYYDPYYDPYGYRYGGYGSRYYGTRYGYPYGGYGYPYGWYDGFYYPGAGYYVYDRSGSRHRWTDRQRRHWESQSKGMNRAVEEWSRRQPGAATGTSIGTTSSIGTSSSDGGVVRVRVPRQSSEMRRERFEQRQERREARQMQRSEAEASPEPVPEKQPE
jgi:hypothetical protein